MIAFRWVMPRQELIADILKVGVPGLMNTAITNSRGRGAEGNCWTVGREAAIGYARGARQYRRARDIAWTGVTTVAGLCGAIG